MADASNSPARVAIVTGAAQGIGEAIALRLAEDGFDVAVNDMSTKAEQLATVVKALEAKGRKAIPVPGDVTDEGDVAAMIEKTVELLGGLDVMVANAGIFKVHSVLEITVEDWDRVMTVNARSVMLCYKHAARQMIKQGRGGRIIGACSAAGKTGFNFIPTYSASKFAIRGLTQSAAFEFAKHGITVNCYAPGWAATSMGYMPEDEENGGPMSSVLKIMGMPKTPLVEPSDIAGLVSYLAKPEASFITGQTVNINTGWVVD